MSRQILIVDDNENIRKLIAEFLCLEGYAIDIASDGAEAFKKTMLNRYNLIIMDIQMPKMNGIDAVKAVRINLPAIPVIIISGIRDKALIQQARECGADAYLSKPFAINDLVEKVKQLLGSANKDDLQGC